MCSGVTGLTTTAGIACTNNGRGGGVTNDDRDGCRGGVNDDTFRGVTNDDRDGCRGGVNDDTFRGAGG